MFTHQLAQTYASTAGQLAVNRTATAAAETNLDEAVAVDATDAVIGPVALDVSQAKAAYIKSSVALTFKTYAAAVLKQTIALAAGVPLVWLDGGYDACPLTDDFDSVKVTNVDGLVVGTLNIRLLFDPTV